MTGQILAPMQAQSILPVKQPIEQCCYCWYVLHANQAYPESWSSTICPEHDNWILAQLAARRARRKAESEVAA